MSVRIEGRTSTLLAPTVVHTHSGSITKGGAAKGSCPASTAAGALDAATRGRWQGKIFSGTPGIFVASIFGVKPAGNFYWTVFVDNRTAQAGVCGLKLHKGEQLLFAVTDGSQFPIVLSGPARAGVGRPFELKAIYYKPTPKRPAGVATPLAGAHVGGAITNRHGTVTLTAHHAGRLKYTRHRDRVCPLGPGDRARLVVMAGRAPAARIALATLAVALAAAGAAGCGLGPGAGTSEVNLNVTRDFGARSVKSVTRSHVPGSETVMRMLERSAAGPDQATAAASSSRSTASPGAGRTWTGSTTSTASRPRPARPRRPCTAATGSGGTSTTGRATDTDPGGRRIVSRAVRARLRRQATAGYDRMRARTSRRACDRVTADPSRDPRPAGQPADRNGLGVGHDRCRRRRRGARSSREAAASLIAHGPVGQWRLRALRRTHGQHARAARPERAGP